MLLLIMDSKKVAIKTSAVCGNGNNPAHYRIQKLGCDGKGNNDTYFR